MSDRPVSAMILRFSANSTGGMRCRVTDATNGQSWLILDASSLYANLRSYAKEQPQTRGQNAQG